MKHFKYGGSSAHRVMECPAWLELSSNLPKQHGSNEYADRGTLLHNCIEKLINDQTIVATSLIGESYNDITLDQEMLTEALIPALDAYDDFATAENFQMELAEATLTLPDDDEIGGTADILAVSEDAIILVDHKFGSKLISPIENAQGLFYAMVARDSVEYGKLFTPERQRLVLAINQPKPEGEVMTYWETDIARLNEFTEQYFDALDDQDIEKPCAGEHCRYCPALAICPSKTGAARKALMIDPKSTEAAELSEAMAMVAEMESWCKAVKQTAHEQAELGLEIKGFKLVAKRAIRKWIDEQAVMKRIRNLRKIKIGDVTETKVKTVPQLEKYCKTIDVDFGKFDVYYDSVSSGTTLATESDKRPAIANISAIAGVIEQIND